MCAYIILEIDVRDTVLYEDYKKLAPLSVQAYGGKYLVRGGQVEPIEGDWQPSRIVVLEFENSEKAKSWLNSSEYKPAWEMRKKGAFTRSILVEGI